MQASPGETGRTVIPEAGLAWPEARLACSEAGLASAAARSA